MGLGDWIGQSFRDTTGMPTKYTTYNIRLKPFKEIIECINQIKDNVINYFEETNNYEWQTIVAKGSRAEYQMLNGKLSIDDYSSYLTALEFEKRKIIGNFVESTDKYFVTAFMNKLNVIKEQNKRDKYISLMIFDTWEDMLTSLELAQEFVTIFESSAAYVDAKRVDELYEKFKRERHLRRGR